MTNSLNVRQWDMLRIFATAHSDWRIADLMERYGRRERTVRYDLKEIRTFLQSKGLHLRYEKRRGYFIPTEERVSVAKLFTAGALVEDDTECADRADERLFFSLFPKDRRISSEALCDVLFVSRATLLRRIAGFSVRYRGRMQIVSDLREGYRLDGSEEEIWKECITRLSRRWSGSYSSEDWFFSLPEEFRDTVTLTRLVRITHVIKRLNAYFNVWQSNDSFLRILACAVAFFVRASSSPIVDSSDLLFDYPDRFLSEIFGADAVRTAERNYIAAIAAQMGITGMKENLNVERLNDAIDEALSELQSIPNIQLDWEMLRKDLRQHLTSLFQTDRRIYEDDNAFVVRDAKRFYPGYFKLAERCAHVMEQALSVSLTQVEIGFLAVYLYKNRKEKQRSFCRAALVCATGKGLSHLISLRLERLFPTLRIVAVCSPYQWKEERWEEEMDCILSTVPIVEDQIPVIRISRIVSPGDIRRVQNFLDYGEWIDAIPLRHCDEASFNQQEDPYLLADASADVEVMREASSAFGKLILTLLEYTSKFPKELQMEQDALLGLIIHISMALPRWMEYEEAITDKTVAVLYVKSHHCVQKGMVSPEAMVEIAHRHGLPLLIDAAAEEDLTKYLSLGADLVIYSGSKALEATTSGFVAGRREYMDWIRRQYHGIGRPMKVGKESIMGLLAALDAYVHREEQERKRQLDAKVYQLYHALEAVKGLDVSVIEDEAGRAIRRVRIGLSGDVDTLLTMAEIDRRLRAGNPMIVGRTEFLNLGWLDFDPRPLKEEDIAPIVERLQQIMEGRDGDSLL